MHNVFFSFFRRWQLREAYVPFRASKIYRSSTENAINGSISCKSIHLSWRTWTRRQYACFKGRFFPSRYYRGGGGRGLKETVAARVAAWFMHQTGRIRFMQILLQLNWFGSKPDRAYCCESSNVHWGRLRMSTRRRSPPGKIHPAVPHPKPVCEENN